MSLNASMFIYVCELCDPIAKHKPKYSKLRLYESVGPHLMTHIQSNPSYAIVPVAKVLGVAVSKIPLAIAEMYAKRAYVIRCTIAHLVKHI